MLFAAPTAIGSGNGERIVGGSPASPGEYPAQGFLQIEDPPGNFGGRCGGTLLDSRHFLTAAHCVVESGVTLPPDRFLIGLNSVTYPAGMDVYSVIIVDVHAGYVAATHQNDLAMLTLDAPAPYTPLRVIRTDENPFWAANTTATIVGWGTTSSNGPVSNTLLEATAPMRDDATCQSPLSYGPAFDPNTMVCAGNGTTDTCQGDSGGPLMVPHGGLFVLVGVTSWGFGCADPDYPGIYARLGGAGLNQWVLQRHAWTSFSVGAAHSGQPVTFTASTFQPGPSGAFTALGWDFDNNFQYNEANGPSVTRTFPTGGAFTVGVEASGGGDKVAFRRVIVVNGTPTAEAGGPYTIREGGSGSFAGSGIDPEGQPLTFGWDLDRNGSYETSGANPAISAARTDGPVTLTVDFRACDAPGACSADTASVRITNVAPRVRGGRDRRARRGQRVRIRASVTDPGVGDRIRISWTCGNGRRGTGRTATCRYRRAGRFTVRFTARDDDGARGTDSVRVRVRR